MERLSFDPGADFNDLAVGETRTTSVTYTISDGEGGTSTATATVTVTGVNDAPTSTALANQTGADASSVNLDVSGAFSDPDATDALAFSASGLPAGLSIDPVTGVISGTIDHSASASGPYSVTVTATDPSGATTSQTFTWTVTNPAPAAQDDAFAASENTIASGNVLVDNGSGADADPDGDALTVSAVNGVAGNVGSAVAGGNGGSFTIGADGALSFDPGADFNDLAVGETRTTSVTYTISDGEGGTSTATATVTVTGVNDAPTSTALANQTGADASSVNLDVSGAFSDPDATDALAFSASGLPAGLSIDPVTGVISGTIDHSASASGPYSVTVTATDPSGATTSQTFTWTVTNPAPAAQDDAFAASENTVASGNVLVDNGSGADADPDGDALTVSAVNGVAGNVGSAVAGGNGGSFTIGADGTLSFDPGADFNDLAVGETRTTSVTYTISDGEGGTSTATATVTVTGVNDAPTSTALANQSGADASSVNLDVSGAFSDPDATDALAFSASGLPAGLSIDPVTGVISGTIDHSASASGPYSVTVTATDPSGATTSQTFTWTVTNPAPAAQDDAFAASENTVASGNVLVDNGSGADADPDGDALTVSAVNGVAGNVGSAVAGGNGGSFTIGADGTLSFDPGADFNDLAVGETRTTSVTYTISDGEGGTSTATATVTVTGVNDAPTSTALANQTGADASSVNLDVSGAFSDPDATDALAFSASGLPAGLSIDPVTGVISGTIDHSASASGPYSVTVTATDPSGATTSQTFTWTVTNPAPAAQDDAFAASENTIASGNVLVDNGSGADADPDGDALTVSAVNGVAGNVGSAVAGGNGGSFTIGADGTLSFDPGADFNDLAVGETRTTSVTYTISDGEGGTSTATATVTVTGVNDAPTSTALANQTGADASSVNLDVSGAFSDPDATDALAFSASGLPAGLSIDPVTGVISGTIDHSASASGPYSVTVTATDPSGATTSQTFTWTVTNPAPAAQDDAFAASENTVASGNVLVDNGSGADADPDGDALTVSAVNGVAGNVGSAVAGGNGGSFTIGADGTLSFDPGADFNDLAVGETRTTSVTYTISDGEGGTSTATATVTVTGVNDAPTSTALANQTGADASSVNLDVSGAFSDPDATDALAFSASGLPAGLSIDPVTGVISGTIDHSASASGPYSVTVTATDPSGATTSQTFTWTVTNPAPAAQDDAFAASENTIASGNVLVDNGSGADADPDGDALTVSAVNGVAGNVGSAVAGGNGGSFTIGADGTLSFDPGADFNDLAVGETRTTSVTYTISDGEGGTSTATATVTVTGVNDAPTSTALANQTGADASSVNLDVSGAFSDPDATDALAFSASGLPAGLSIDPVTGVISGTIDHSASASGPYSVTVTATDPSGATTSQTFTWTVTNPAPAAQDDAFAVDEDGSVLISVLTNDSDQDGDSLTVTQIDGQDVTVGVPVILADHSGRVTLNADGTLTFLPSNNYVGPAIFTYTVSDGEGGTSTATVTGVVSPVNDEPEGTDATLTTAEDTPYTFSAADFGFGDPSDTPANAFASVIVTTLPGSGALTLNGVAVTAGQVIAATDIGGLVWTPATDANGAGVASFTFQVVDDGGVANGGVDTDQSPNTITFDVTPVNDAPVASAPPATTAEDTPVSGAITASDVDGDALSFATTTPPAHGTVTVDPATGAYTYTPDPNYNGPDSFVVTVSDGNGGVTTVTVPVTVTPVNDAPVASAPPATTAEDTPVTGAITASDVDGDTLSFTTTTPPAHGTVTVDPATGAYTYTPDPNYAGPDSFVVTVSDGNGGVTTVTVPVTVTPVNDAPVASAPPATTAEDTPVSGAITASDVDGDALSFATTTPPAHGTVTVDPATGAHLHARPELQRAGLFVVTVIDGNGGVTTVTVPVTVTPVNDAPVASCAAGDDGRGHARDGRDHGERRRRRCAELRDDDAAGARDGDGRPGDGRHTYTPDPNYAGPDSFVVTVSDGNGGVRR
ncbi:MAG: tandem-95 repeat protein [Rhizobiales bacterium]|nr:tandem-95 repeat protein [Hyphomicrobiales bacterium]